MRDKLLGDDKDTRWIGGWNKTNERQTWGMEQRTNGKNTKKGQIKETGKMQKQKKAIELLETINYI